MWSRCGLCWIDHFGQLGEMHWCFFELEGKFMIDARAVKYCAHVEFWWQSIFF